MVHRCIAEAAAVFESKFKVPVVLAVFDTLAKIAGFKNENDNSECTAAFQTLDRIAQAGNVFALTPPIIWPRTMRPHDRVAGGEVRRRRQHHAYWRG